MGGYWFDVGLIAVLMVVNGVFAGSEIALISLREGQLKALERRGTRRSRTVVELARDPNRFLGTIQLGITLAGYLASATAAVTLALPVVAALKGIFGDAADAVGIAIVTLALTAVNLVVGELAPKRLGMQYAQGWALAIAMPLNVLAIASRPVTKLLGAATDVLVRLVGGNPQTGKAQLSPEELRELVAGHPGLSAEQRTIITGALEIRERTLREVLVPRRAVVTLPDDMDVVEARKVLARSGHSHAPVVRDHELDSAVGVVHLRHLLGEHAAVSDVARPALALPDNLHVADALRRFKSERQQFALVIDEHGGVAGIVTLEDLLEEIVGEIYDETDRDVLAVRRLPDGTIVVPGAFPIHDLPDIGIELAEPHGDFTTIAGLVLSRLGRIPTTPGDCVELPDWTVKVAKVAEHAIAEVWLLPVGPRSHDPGTG
ncbi:hemolysin family protein [Mycobacterium sp. CVI_P3]|uniref:Hemolysin family protein n=1 Tax=Mycobacterium pinniadriaticum TaxID=2994102 RepID=A0ABT3SL69_9MYCO|nr:hemolysin family protein [Mycobacterium pinniadriaticum]MCX2933123.1 hemolysin family protein [Mycobacterium pinniadriaticum]MCX2939577.1 hemolysin family protein [Mycobacterium pinniadriaticum]